MLLDNLLEPSIVQLGEFSQIMNISNDITQDLLEEQKILIGRRRTRNGPDTRAAGSRRIPITFQPRDDIVHVLFAGLDAPNNLLTLDPLEVKNLVEVVLQQGDETLLVIFGPGFAVWFWAFGGWFLDEVGLEGFFQFVVGDVVPVVLLNHRRAEMFSEPKEQVTS